MLANNIVTVLKKSNIDELPWENVAVVNGTAV